MARLSEDQRSQAISMLRVGSTVNAVSHDFGRSRQTIILSFEPVQHYWICQRPWKTRSRTFDNVTYWSHDHVNSPMLSFWTSNHYCSVLRGYHLSLEAEPSSYSCSSSMYWTDHDPLPPSFQTVVGVTSFAFHNEPVASSTFQWWVPFYRQPRSWQYTYLSP